MAEFCIGLGILLITIQFKKDGMKITGLSGMFIFGCACWGLGKLTLLCLGVR